jgi:hypothetical protein
MRSLKHIRILPHIAGAALLLTCFQAGAAGYKLADKAGASIAEMNTVVATITPAKVKK